ncbi:interferon beta-like [Heptranchias perlo]|uniref:interferon beta-like n=1 Tax=Heptranchias perlo TaxID=212740 RepID=UPI00355A0EBC
MALSSIWRFWILSVLLAGTLSLGCERLRLQYVLNTETLSKLNEMGGRMPLHCMTRRGALQTQSLDLVTLSKNLNAEDKILVIHQTLHQINKTFSENRSSTPWDSALIENFLLQLNQQLEELRECQREPLSDSMNEEIQEYFGKLREFLELERFSDCAWKVVRSRTRTCLLQIPTIIAKIRKNN